MNRYIDVTDITKKISNLKKTVNSPNNDYMTGYWSALSVTEGMIAETPAADVAPIADTVKKMHSKIKEYFENDGFYPAKVAVAVDEIVKEMLEGENGTTIC